ncbi:hypothetical protein CBL_04429 [Carabus blaptoides fortunei]
MDHKDLEIDPKDQEMHHMDKLVHKDPEIDLKMDLMAQKTAHTDLMGPEHLKIVDQVNLCQAAYPPMTVLQQKTMKQSTNSPIPRLQSTKIRRRSPTARS